MSIPLIAVVGPTASGKTKLAVQISLRFNGEVVSADSMQIYRGMDIGVAKPTQEEMCGIPHHLIGILDPKMSFSVADYKKLADREITDIFSRGKTPVLCGGTGLYIDAVMKNITFPDIRTDPVLRKELERRAQEEGAEKLLADLKKIDPELAKELHPNNLKRIIRALEVYRLSGVTMSEHMRRSRELPSPYSTYMIGLTFHDRQKLYDRIDTRVDDMLKRGLVEEARSFYESGFGKTSVQAIGYKELFPFFNGEVSYEEAVERIKRETRRYAKRQLTWFRRNEQINWIYMDDNE